MAYEGQIASLKFGFGGIHTDIPQGLIPPTDLIRAINVSVENARIVKEGGSVRWNTSALPSGIKKAIEFWPDESTQRLIVVCKNGKVYKFKDIENYSEITPELTSTQILNVSSYCTIVCGGNEASGNDRKLFIFTGNSPVQVISGDENTRRDITSGAVDWTGTSHPFFGIIHRNRLFAFGNKNDPHRIYASLGTNHEDFTTTPLQFSIYPGESERLISSFIFKGKLFLLKYPEGIYYLEDEDPSTANWQIPRLGYGFGGASPNCSSPYLDDVIIANNYGSMTSVKSTQEFGNIKTGDIFQMMEAEEFLRDEVSKTGLLERDVIYYGDKKTIFATYRSAGGIKNDRICRIDFRKERPVITWSTKDQANCLFTFKDVEGIPRPFYGADDGYIYAMDRKDFNVGGSSYRSEFQTPHMDFSAIDMTKSEMNKNFQFLELVYEATGNFKLKVDVFIDLKYSETIEFDLNGNSELDTMVLDDDDNGMLMPSAQLSQRCPLSGSGRRISFKCYNEGNGESFIVNGLNIYYQDSGQQQLEID